MCCVMSAALRLDGANVGYLPGDAYFRFAMNEELLKSFENDGEPEQLCVSYVYPVEHANFGGYVGFDKLRIALINEENTIDLLRQAHDLIRRYEPKTIQEFIREDGTRKVDELNGLDVFVYNRGTDWNAVRVAVRYNDVWRQVPASAYDDQRTEPASFLGKKTPAEIATNLRSLNRGLPYHPLVKGTAFVVEDWKNHDKVPPLSIVVPPDVAWAIPGPEAEEPLTASVGDLEFLVLPHGRIKEHFNRREDHEFYMVRDSVLRCRWKQGKLVTESLDESPLDINKESR